MTRCRGTTRCREPMTVCRDNNDLCLAIHFGREALLCIGLSEHRLCFSPRLTYRLWFQLCSLWTLEPSSALLEFLSTLHYHFCVCCWHGRPSRAWAADWDPSWLTCEMLLTILMSVVTRKTDKYVIPIYKTVLICSDPLNTCTECKPRLNYNSKIKVMRLVTWSLGNLMIGFTLWLTTVSTKHKSLFKRISWTFKWIWMVSVYLQSLKGEWNILCVELESQVFFTQEFLNQLHHSFWMNKKYLSIVSTVSHL